VNSPLYLIVIMS